MLIIVLFKIFLVINYYMGIGDWGLGIGDWGLGSGPNPPSPIPNPPSPIPNPHVPERGNVAVNNINEIFHPNL